MQRVSSSANQHDLRAWTDPIAVLISQHSLGARLEEPFGQVPEAELIPEASQHYQVEDISGILQSIKRRSRPFINPALIVVTAKAEEHLPCLPRFADRHFDHPH